MLTFPSEADQLRRRTADLERLTATERMRLMIDLLNAAEALSLAGGCRQRQLEFHQRLEDQWRERIQDCINKHV